MGYDMYLIKVDKRKIRNINNPYYEEIDAATIRETNSYYPVLREFYENKDDLFWKYEEYNIVSRETLLEIISWLKEKIKTERFLSLDSSEETMTKMVYNEIKDWNPLTENEIVYFEEDS